MPTQFGLFPSMSDIAEVPRLCLPRDASGQSVAFNYDIHVEFATSRLPALGARSPKYQPCFRGHWATVLSNPASLITG